MQKDVIGGLVLGAVIITAIIAFWFILQEPAVGEAIIMKPYCQGPGCGIPPPAPIKPSPTPTPSTTTTTRPTPTPTATPYPTEEPTPPPFTYELIEKDYCKMLTDALTARRPDLTPYCTGKYDPDTGEWSFMLGFTWTFPH